MGCDEAEGGRECSEGDRGEGGEIHPWRTPQPPRASPTALPVQAQAVDQRAHSAPHPPPAQPLSRLLLLRSPRPLPLFASSSSFNGRSREGADGSSHQLTTTLHSSYHCSRLLLLCPYLPPLHSLPFFSSPLLPSPVCGWWCRLVLSVMANPLLRIFSQIGLSLATVVGKAFKQAYAKISADAAASQRRGVGSGAAGGGAGAGGGGGAGGASSMGWLTRGRAMPVDEAYKVLNIDPKAANPSDIAQVSPAQLHRHSHPRTSLLPPLTLTAASAAAAGV